MPPQYTNLSSQHFAREEQSVSEIFAQEARKRAEHILSLRDPGLMRDDEDPVPLKAKVVSFVRNYHMYIMMAGMMVIMSGSMGGTMGKNKDDGSMNTTSNLRASGDQEGTGTFVPSGFGYFEEETFTGTFDPSEWGPIEFECEDDPEFLYQGVEGQDCEWAGSEHLGDRCGHVEVYESCLWTCHPECTDEEYDDDDEEEEEEEETSSSTPEPEPEDEIYEEEEEEEENIMSALTEPEEEEEETSMSEPAPIEEEEEEEILEEETSTSTNTWGPIECVDDPDFLYQGVEGQNCEWAGTEHLGDRCGHLEVYESCLLTCHPECTGTFNPSSFGTFTSTNTGTSIIDDNVAIGLRS